jgi:MFS family permease
VLDRRFILLLVTLGVFAFGAYNFSFVLLKAGSLGIEESHIPLVYAALNVSTVAIGLPAGMLADKIGKIRVLGLGYVVFLVTSLAGIFLSGNPLYGFALAFLFGGYLAISETIQRAIVPDFTRPELKGTAYAIYYSLIGLGSLVANAVFGMLWSWSGPSTAFQYSAITAAAGIVALAVFIRENGY